MWGDSHTAPAEKGRCNPRGGTGERTTIRRCRFCGEWFIPRARANVYCDAGCREGAEELREARKREEKPARECVICGKAFTPRVRTQITCGAECSAARQRDKIREWNARASAKRRAAARPRRRVCVKCGKEFMMSPNTRRQMYCDKACRVNKVFKPRECDVCGSVFTPLNSLHVRCSEACRTIRHAQRRQATRRGRSRRECQECGKALVVHERGALPRFCSEACWKLSRHVVKPCEECGDDFRGPKHRRFCSSECRRAARHVKCECVECGIVFFAVAARDRCGAGCGEPVPLRDCAHCGEPFPRHGARKYCSESCRAAERRARDRARYSRAVAAQRAARQAERDAARQRPPAGRSVASDGTDWDAVIQRIAASSGPEAALRFRESLESMRARRAG